MTDLLNVFCRVQNTMFQSLDDKFRECEVLRKDPGAILSNEKHRYVSKFRGLMRVICHSRGSGDRSSLLVDP